MAWLTDKLRVETDDCIIWPFANDRSGRGVVLYRGNYMAPYRAACFEVFGDPPTPEHQTAHSCGNGHLACVNKRHLRWATSKENSEDTVAHGRQVRGERISRALLNREQVIEIRGLLEARQCRQQDLAERYGVSKQLISAIHNRACWAWV
ncbi:hypothetical protein [Hansschlegelia plantiphila]|uniref:hypothetical protein n=1 Tax=Hansschlegelia plantiphila TaxID=374655 RepID=UPI0022F28A3A|nr:hypothetical protein [Hansschlegelia plantiphila]